MQDVTRTFTDPPSPARRTNRWIAVQVAVTAAVLWFVGHQLVDPWEKFRRAPVVAMHPRWGLIALSCVVVLATYGVLIETWRRIVVTWGDALPFSDAASLWFVSNLVRYVPYGSLLQIGTLAELARRRRISPIAAAGASVINVAVNIATGFIVALWGGFAALNALANGHAALGAWGAAILVLALLLLPNMLPSMLVLLQRVTGRELALRVLPRRAIYVSLFGNVAAWMLYGVAFELLVRGVLGRDVGSAPEYIALWAGAYVIGYLAFLLPAGVGARELAMTNGLGILHIVANVGEAGIIAIVARLWLTVLEIIPALIYLARGAGVRPQATTPRDGSIP